MAASQLQTESSQSDSEDLVHRHGSQLCFKFSTKNHVTTRGWIHMFTAIMMCSSLLLQPVVGYFISIDAHAEECYYDRVKAGTKMGLTFEVIDGGFLDIDAKITGPDGKIIHQEDRASSGKYTFAAQTEGIYTYCFGNKMSTMTPKVVMFSMDVADEPVPSAAGSHEGDATADHNKLEEMIKELSHALTAVKHEQEYMAVRDRIHRTINESTNSRVVLWAFFEAVVLVAMTLGQVYYLKRFFEVRRVV